MAEEQIDLDVTEETVGKKTKTEEIKEKQKNAINKFLKQEDFTTPSGKKLTVTFPGIEEAQDLIDDANSAQYAQQYLSQYHKHELYLDKILEDNLKIADFEKELRKAKKTIEVEEDDGKKTKYTLQFPKLQTLEQTQEELETTGKSKPLNKMILEQVLTKPLSMDYFNTHSGYGQIIVAGKEFLNSTYEKSDYKFVIDYIEVFLGRMFL